MAGALTNKVALVTGSSRGIGKAVAMALAREGAEVLVNCARSVEEGEGVVREVKARGGQATLVVASVANPPEVRGMMDRVLAAHGRLDVLVNNAGIAIRGALQDISEETWDQVIDVNLKGTFLCCQAAAPIMLRQGSGSIVNVSSIRGLAGSDRSPHYAAAKGGVLALTKSLARELAPSVRVNAIAPGYVETQLHAGMNAEVRRAVESSIPLRRFGQPPEIAELVVFLASDAAYITGQTIVIDGGLVMH